MGKKLYFKLVQIFEDVTLYVDQDIKLSDELQAELKERGVAVYLKQDSKVAAGIQVADHAAHFLGGMLLEEMGIVRKKVLAGENSGYDPDDELEIGFELWASLRYSIVGNTEGLPDLNTGPDGSGPYFLVDGYGMYVAPTCSKELSTYVLNRFRVNYLGCIH